MLSYVALQDKSASHYQVVISSDLLGWADAAANITVTVIYTPPAGIVTQQ